MTDEFYMKHALAEAQKAYDSDEVPVGAVVVVNNQIIGRGYNQVEMLQDCTAHAEMIAITAALSTIGGKYLPDATIYITLEPCLMCAGALFWSKIGRVVFAAQDLNNGYSRLAGIPPEKRNVVLHPKTEVSYGICSHESLALLRRFFEQLRERK